MAKTVAAPEHLQPLDPKRLWQPARDPSFGSLRLTFGHTDRPDFYTEPMTQQPGDRRSQEVIKQRLQMSRAVGGGAVSGSFFDAQRYDRDIAHLELTAEQTGASPHIRALKRELVDELRKERREIFTQQLQTLNTIRETTQAAGTGLGVLLRTGSLKTEQLRVADLASFYMAEDTEQGTLTPGVVLADQGDTLGLTPVGWSIAGLCAARPPVHLSLVQ